MLTELKGQIMECSHSIVPETSQSTLYTQGPWNARSQEEPGPGRTLKQDG